MSRIVVHALADDRLCAVGGRRRWLYQIVLREASRAEDLTGYLDRDTLIAVGPELHLPNGVRQAWEELHPQMRAASAGTA